MEIAVVFKLVMEFIATGNYSAAVITLLAAFSIFQWLKINKIEKSQNPKEEKTDYNQYIAYDNLISQEIESIRSRYGADRVVVIDIANGSYNLGNIGTLKIFVRNERLKTGVFSISNNSNGTPAAFFNRILKQVVKGEPFKLESVYDLENEDFGLYENMTAANVKSYYAFPLISNDGVLYGMITIHFCMEHKKLSEEDIKKIEEDVERINGEILMMRSLKR